MHVTKLRAAVTHFILEIVEGERSGRQFPLTGALEAGRDPGLPLSVNDEQMSRRHARFSPAGAVAVIEDLESTNGVYVNDEPIHGRRELRPGDRIRLGLTVFELRTTQQVAAQPSAVRPIPPITAVGAEVLQPVPAEQPPSGAPATPALGSFMVEETEPTFVPPEVLGDEDAESDYRALAALVDPRVKRQTNIAAFAVLALAALAVAIFFGVR